MLPRSLVTWNKETMCSFDTAWTFSWSPLLEVALLVVFCETLEGRRRRSVPLPSSDTSHLGKEGVCSALTKMKYCSKCTAHVAYSFSHWTMTGNPVRSPLPSASQHFPLWSCLWPTAAIYLLFCFPLLFPPPNSSKLAWFVNCSYSTFLALILSFLSILSQNPFFSSSFFSDSDPVLPFWSVTYNLTGIKSI